MAALKMAGTNYSNVDQVEHGCLNVGTWILDNSMFRMSSTTSPCTIAAPVTTAGFGMSATTAGGLLNLSTEVVGDRELDHNADQDLMQQFGDNPEVFSTALMIPTGIGLYTLSLLTFVGNAMVLYAIRTEKRLQTVGQVPYP